MRKRTTIRILSFLSAGVIAAGALAVTAQRRARSLELYARANTQHAFDELVTSVSELSTALEKSIYVTDPALESALCTQMFGRAVTAQMAMGSLPYSSQELEQTAGFLSRVGDYACTLARTVGANGGYSEEELHNLTELADTANVMAMNLQDMQSRLMAGRLTMDEVYTTAAAVQAQEDTAPLAGTAFQSMEAEFPELPTLIYDGPFSESMTSPIPVCLDGMPEADEETAKQTAARFLGAGEKNVTPLGECGGDIPCWCFGAYLAGGEYSVYVTKQGGMVMSVLSSRLPGQARLSAEEARAIAAGFMEQVGFSDMEESYHRIEGGILTVNFEYEQEGVLCYPDLVKVGVALDNGAIMSYDAKGYLSAHQVRELSAPVISEEDALATASPALSVRSVRLAVIPSEGGEEKLCYELTGRSAEGRRYLLYVNAATGAQERILILLEDETGTLTL